MNGIEAVIFDMDGLMFDTERLSYEQNQKAADELGFRYSVEDYKETIGMSGQAYINYISRKYSSSKLVDKFLNLSKIYRQQALSNPANIKEKDGLRRLLDILQEYNIPMYIASSSKSEVIKRNIQAKKLDKYFRGYIGGDQVKLTKPDPEIYLKCVEMSDVVNKSNVLVLEDSRNGFIAARRAGLEVIVVPDMVEPDDAMKENALEIVSSLHDVVDFCKLILS